MAATVVTVRTPSRQPIVLLLEDRLELGRDCVGLVVPDSRMSRRHVGLEPTPDGPVLVTDLGSSNGTTLDGERVLFPVPAGPGSVVRAGNTEIIIGSQRDLHGAAATGARDDTSMATSIEVVAEHAIEDLRPEVVGIRNEPGTLTLGLTDIERSTDLAVALGDREWLEVLR